MPTPDKVLRSRAENKRTSTLTRADCDDKRKVGYLTLKRGREPETSEERVQNVYPNKQPESDLNKHINQRFAARLMSAANNSYSRTSNWTSMDVISHLGHKRRKGSTRSAWSAYSENMAGTNLTALQHIMLFQECRYIIYPQRSS